MLQAALAPVVLRGRERELLALRRLLRAADEGHGGALVVAGERGIGKSALLRRGVEGCESVERIAAVEAEMELPYAGLHLLCNRFDTGRLPTPQREALDAAFGLRATAAPSPFLVALGVLSLLADAASARPLVCIVDDAHWLDDASAQVLGFVARRLAEERVVLILAAREVPGGLAGLPSCRSPGSTPRPCGHCSIAACRAPSMRGCASS